MSKKPKDKKDEILALHSLSDQSNAQAVRFFDAVAAEVLGDARIRDKLQVILVAHAYENVLPFIQSLDRVFTVAGVILKNSTGSMRPEYDEYVAKQGYTVLQVKKSDFSETNQKAKAYKKIARSLDPEKKTIIMDHGGYFAFADGGLLARPEFPPDKMIAITEYAANGEERWKKVPMDRPIISIGYSAIKEASDFAAAESVVDGAVYFSQTHNVPLMAKSMSIGVIGHGRLGAGITNKFFRNLAQVSVYDTNAVKVSGLRHVHVLSREKIVRNSDVIFCATGNKAIVPTDFKNLKDGVVIFTVTSPDDELNLGTMIEKGVLTPSTVKGQAHSYTVAENGNKLWLPFNGESSNTILSSSVNDPTILQPYALHMVATIKAFQHLEYYHMPTVHRFEPRYEDLVARVWNKHFNPDANGPH